MKRWFPNIFTLNIRMKLILLFGAAIILPLIIINQVVIKISEAKIQEQALSIALDSANQNLVNVRSLLERYTNICNRYSYNDEIITTLSLDEKYEDRYTSYQAYKRIENMIVNDAMTKDFQISMKIYYFNMNFSQDLVNFIQIQQEIQQSEMFKQTMEANGAIVWGYHGGKFSLSKVMKDYQGTPLAIIHLELPESEISTLFDKYKPEEMQVAIFDSNGTVLTSNDVSIIGLHISENELYREDHERLAVLPDRTGELLTLRNRFIQLNPNLPNWEMVTTIPLNRVFSESNALKKKVLIVFLISLIISCVIFLSVSERIIQRIKNLMLKMREVGEGKFHVIEDSNSNDELGVMIRSFNKMSENLNRLFHENVRTRLQLKDITIKKHEAELYALQSQIHPHFLFNLLESIRMKLHKNNVDEAMSMILNLSKMLRKSLNMKNEIISLSEELDFVKSFLEIQKYRFKDKLQYHIEAADHLLSHPIPKLIIQPLVENAIKHGVEKKWGGGRVNISVYSQSDRIYITVEDDGIGMEPDTLTEIKAKLREKDAISQEKIGLKNVHDRIVLHYGQPFHLHVESNTDQGTKVVITLPYSSIGQTE